MTEWRKILAGTLAASICLFGLTAQVDAAGKPAGKTQRINDWSRKSTDHPKLDRKLNDRSDKGGFRSVASDRDAEAGGGPG